MIKELIIEELEYIKTKTEQIKDICENCKTWSKGKADPPCDRCHQLEYIIDLRAAQTDIEEEINELQGTTK